MVAADLAAGQRQTVTFRVKASAAGDWPLSPRVLSQNLAEATSNTRCTPIGRRQLKLDVSREEIAHCRRRGDHLSHAPVFNKGDALAPAWTDGHAARRREPF